MLYPGEKVYGEQFDYGSNAHFTDLTGKNGVVKIGGEDRLLTYQARTSAYGSLGVPTFEDAGFKELSEAEILDKAIFLEETEGRLSDVIDFPAKDQNGLPYCFPGETLIRMADGSEKPIKDVKVLDMVVTAEGRIGRVKATMARHVDEPLWTPVIWGHAHLRATSEHPILTKRGYVPLCELQAGDMVAFPKYMANEHSFIETGDYIAQRNTAKQSRRKYRQRAETEVTEYKRGLPGRKQTTIRANPIPEAIRLTPGMGRLVGLYLAEGHSSPWTAHWSFNVREHDTFATEVSNLLQSEVGAEGRIRIRPNNVAQVVLNGVNWAHLFEALCGHHSNGKRLHRDLTAGPPDFLHNVLTGWMDGDRQKGTAAVSVSRMLAMNMFDIANARGNMPILGTHGKAGVYKDGIERQRAWKVAWSENGVTKHGTEQDDTHLWRRVRSLKSEPFSGFVFNIEVEGDNSYVAEGIGVHNCWIYGTTGAVEAVRRVQGFKEWVELSPESAGGPITGYRSRGGYGEEGLKYGSSVGFAAQTLWPRQKIGGPSNITAEVKASYENHKIGEWFDGKTNSLNQLWSLLLMGMPCPLGLNWWGHLIYACDVVVDRAANKIVGTRIRNSHGKDAHSKNKHGVAGFLTLTPGKSQGDFFGIRSVTKSTL